MRSRGERHEPRGTHPLRDDIDLLDGAWYADDLHEGLTWMRENAPVYHDPWSDCWAITTYDDVMAVSKDSTRFSNAFNIRPGGFGVPMMISMDDPEHKRRRMLVSKGFTPKRVRDKSDDLVEICDALIDAVAAKGECDFVNDVARHLPLIVIGDMLGVAPADRMQLLEWSEILLEGTSGDLDALDRAGDAFGQYWAYQSAVIEERRRVRGDDLVSVLVDAEIDDGSGPTMLDEESLIWESLLILIGGDETTRHVLSGGLHALLSDVSQRDALAADRSLLPGAVEEMLRWVSPIKTMSRRVVADTDFGGQSLREGDDVLLYYPSANRDAAHFDDPFRFDIRRDPNHHIAFGFGHHFCLGNALARLELSVFFDRLLDRLPDVELGDGPTPRRASSFISGFESLPVRFTPT
ncbi:cytochrome P450 [Actinospongicola halichondriae]|uniref:cytochrome P450 n=1 Tax=Actinospongicola halichondriae TaxID=3236844 RepID=UPI003D53B667